MSNANNITGLDGQARDKDACSRGDLLPDPHATPIDKIFSFYQSSKHGLSHSEAATRLGSYGPNSLPETKPPGMAMVFVHQFSSPHIYVLIIAALLSVVIEEWSDTDYGVVVGIVISTDFDCSVLIVKPESFIILVAFDNE